MMNKTNFKKDLANRKILVEREFNAPLEVVWKAWTEPAQLDQWWAPKPWKAKTKKMDFREGGHWLYCMKGPEGEKHWSRADFKIVDPPNRYAGQDAFCDENGQITDEMPQMYWDVQFEAKDRKTLVKVDITFSSEADLEKIVEMGFQEGFAAGHENLDELLEQQALAK
ncbi:SRPBCC domain-containing protein [Echinicola jeungdonensis]|uniref:SRPBCC domain-containing protein n=1 Tax=Echinicola jeungdonensis TaxID=709343 RepID=A0ABV5J8E9_9BACT|nr:SRPBCC domain-containing protein [Echinicola jeungdonensis]MDN3669070.1 SRPBCC domain-containing protein [Echinicola jeungdonensis]